MFRNTRQIHFVGIGGIGMSGIAEVLITLGYSVTGSDILKSESVVHLTKLGAKVTIGHNSAAVEKADVVVISSAVKSDNVEVIRAKEKHIPVIPRAEMLAELMRLKKGIAIAGTHGKTTTTSMIATMLAHAGCDPTVVIGGRLNSLGTGARLGEGELMVAEADESDGSFLKLSPIIGVVTTIDQEHMDYYGTMENLLSSFTQFINAIPFYGLSILCLDQPNIQRLIPAIEKRYITYGLKSQADFTARNVRTSGLKTGFSIYQKGVHIGDIEIGMPGLHNVLNSLAAVVIGLELEIEFSVIKQGLKRFSGVQRRFEVVGTKKGITIVDDYGHHPAEIQATLKSAALVWQKGRIYAVFQPHRYSRTKDLLNEFFTVFYDADGLIVTDIYAAGEDAVPEVSSEILSEGIKGHGHKDVLYIKDPEDIVNHLIGIVKRGDVVITLGAGDVWKIGRELLNRL